MSPLSLGEAVVEVGADASGFGRDLSREVDKAAQSANKSLAKIGRGTTDVGKKITLGITTPLAAIGAAAVKSQATFEQSMNLLGVNADIGGAKLEKMGDLAKQLGADTVFSAGEAADAMLELAKGGFSAAQIEGGGVQATMALAATEGLALADAATITGNALNSFGLQAKDAGQIADALAAGSSASSASVASLAEGLANVGPVAKQSGLSLQDTVTALAQLDQAGIKGAEGGTALRSFLTRLVPVGKKAKDAVKELGLSFTEADGSFRSLGDISGQLKDKLGDLTEAQRAEALQTIFGAYAKQAAAVFLESGAKGNAKMAGEVTKLGTAQKLANARMDGTAGALEKMTGSVETAGLALGEALAPTVVKVAGKIEDLANWFTELDEGTQQTITLIGGLVAASGPLLIVTGKLITAYSQVSTALSGFSVASGKATTGVSRFAGVARAAAGAGGILLMADSTNRTSKTMSALEGAAGGALSGAALGAFAGPQGAAIGGAIGALAGGAQALLRGTRDAGDAASGAIGKWQDYAATLDQASGATTELTRKTALHKLGEAEILKTTRELGIADRQVVNAIVDGGKARDKVVAALNREKGAVDASIASKERELAANLKIATDMSVPLARQTAAAEAVKANRQEIEALKDLRTARQEDIDKVLDGVGAVRKGIVETQNSAAAIRDLTGKLEGLPKQARTEIKATGIIPTTEGILELTKRYGLTPKQVKTLVAATGVPFTKGQIQGIINKGKEWQRLNPSTKVDADTGPARAKLDGIMGYLNTIIRTPWNINVGVSRSGGAGLPATASGGVFSGAQARIIAEAGREAVVPLSGSLSSVDPSVRFLSAVAQGKALALPGSSSSRGSASYDHSRTVELTVVNPVAEKTTESLPAAMNTLAFVMGG